ncbi:uncharacterized protein LOC132752207, partial [Ruditapes philippinarum]|uniref:uncharacterized protein LOC132752207 n=1 Tax=Ruditapes philippinarum TaxID=129788 RepID=UPI00295ADD39
MQVIKIILITSQLFSFGKDHGNFSDVVNRGHLTLRHLLLKDWDASWETLAYPPHKGDFAVYTIDDLENGINFAVKGYYNTKREAIGFFQRTTDDTMVIQVKYFDFPGFNDTNVTQGLIIQDKTFSADVGLSLQNQTYNYNIIKELTGNGLKQPIKRMLSTELRFSIHSVRVYEKVRRARCLHVQGWVTFNDMDYNGQVIVNLETLTRRISCKQLNISAQDWALENTSKPLGEVLVFFCLLSMIASTLIITLTVYLCW